MKGSDIDESFLCEELRKRGLEPTTEQLCECRHFADLAGAGAPCPPEVNLKALQATLAAASRTLLMEIFGEDIIDES